MKIEVRQASREDLELCFAITEDSMREYVVATWGVWDPAFQRKMNAESFSPATHWIVFANGCEAGLVAATHEASHVQLSKLYLRSNVRNRGLGGDILQSILRFAAECAKPVRLRVLAVNQRAQVFYARHGFHEAFRTAERVFMEANPRLSIEPISSGTAPARDDRSSL